VEDLVNHLLADRTDVDSATAPRGLGDDRRAVVGDLDDRIAEFLEPVDLLPATRVQATGRLTATFRGVSDRGGHPEPVPVIPGPSELVDQGTEIERDVGHAATDDHVSTTLEGLDDALRAGVDRSMGETDPN